MSKSANHKMIRVPIAVAERLQRIANELTESYEAGRTTEVELTDQGARGMWVPMHAVITKALDELEGHKERSRKSSRKAKWNTVCSRCGSPVKPLGTCSVCVAKSNENVA